MNGIYTTIYLFNYISCLLLMNFCIIITVLSILYMTPGGQSLWDIYLGIKRPGVVRFIFSFTKWCQTLSSVTVTVDTPITKCGSLIVLLLYTLITTFSFGLLQCTFNNVSLWFHFEFPWFWVVLNRIRFLKTIYVPYPSYY